MKIIGITGGSGSGKTTCLNVFRSLGAYALDCDALYHQLLRTSAELNSELWQLFPDAYSGGGLDRKKLGAEVFGNPDKLGRLNEVTHEYVVREVRRLMETERHCGRKLFAIDAILLIECGLGAICDKIIGVTAPAAQRVKRITEREGISAEYAMSRIDAQKNDEFFKSNCDYMLDGGAPKGDFEKACAALFKLLEEEENEREEESGGGGKA